MQSKSFLFDKLLLFFRFLVHRSVWCYRCPKISGPLVWCYCWQVQHIPSATSWLASHPLIAALAPVPQICPTFSSSSQICPTFEIQQ